LSNKQPGSKNKIRGNPTPILDNMGRGKSPFSQTKPLDCFETGVDVRLCDRPTRRQEMDCQENTGKRLATQKSESERCRGRTAYIVNNSQS
jgi:hypothetical protein